MSKRYAFVNDSDPVALKVLEDGLGIPRGLNYFDTLFNSGLGVAQIVWGVHSRKHGYVHTELDITT